MVVWAVVASPEVAGGDVSVTLVGWPVAGAYAVVVVRPSVRAWHTGVASPVAVTVAVRSVSVSTRP